MRPLTEEEQRQVFEKMYQFVGKSLKQLVEREDQPYCFRLHKQRVFYVREKLLRRAQNVARDKLVTLGTTIGKFTHSNKFRLTIGCLDILAQHASNKVWVKPGAEMSFLYGNHVLKSGVGKVSEGLPANTGVVVLSMANIPLGFGVSVKTTSEIRGLDPLAIVVLHQADIGEYLRAEDDL